MVQESHLIVFAPKISDQLVRAGEGKRIFLSDVRRNVWRNMNAACPQIMKLGMCSSDTCDLSFNIQICGKRSREEWGTYTSTEF